MSLGRILVRSFLGATWTLGWLLLMYVVPACAIAAIVLWPPLALDEVVVGLSAAAVAAVYHLLMQWASGALWFYAREEPLLRALHRLGESRVRRWDEPTDEEQDEWILGQARGRSEEAAAAARALVSAMRDQRRKSKAERERLVGELEELRRTSGGSKAAGLALSVVVTPLVAVAGAHAAAGLLQVGLVPLPWAGVAIFLAFLGAARHLSARLLSSHVAVLTVALVLALVLLGPVAALVEGMMPAPAGGVVRGAAIASLVLLLASLTVLASRLGIAAGLALAGCGVQFETGDSDPSPTRWSAPRSSLFVLAVLLCPAGLSFAFSWAALAHAPIAQVLLVGVGLVVLAFVRLSRTRARKATSQVDEEGFGIVRVAEWKRTRIFDGSCGDCHKHVHMRTSSHAPRCPHCGARFQVSS